MCKFLLASLLLLWAFAPLPCLAEDARYNFASAQGGTRIALTSGEEGIGTLFFYNVDGNRITHVSLAVVEAPAGFDVRIDPAPHEVEVLVDEQRVRVTENVYVEPGAMLSAASGALPEGSAFIGLGEGRFAVAKVVKVHVRARPGTSVGPAGKIRVAAEASWLGQTGTAAMKQARDFDFAVEVIPSGAVTERVLGEVAAKPSGATQDPLAALNRVISDSLPAFIAGALALLLITRVAGRLAGKKGGAG